jgi:hypothetical protein
MSAIYTYGERNREDHASDAAKASLSCIILFRQLKLTAIAMAAIEMAIFDDNLIIK